MNRSTIRKRTEPAFIEPMQCKSVTALPSGEKWTFEIKFDGYRCIAVKLGKEGHAILAPRESAQQTHRSGATSFSMESWLRWIRKEDLPFNSMQNSISESSLPICCYAFDLLNRDGELLVNLPFFRRREFLEGCLPHPRIRCACRRCCKRHRVRFSMWCANSGLEGVVGKRIDSIYEPGER
jgi:bifunctional non-homologous end joining protein LigD